MYPQKPCVLPVLLSGLAMAMASELHSQGGNCLLICPSPCLMTTCEFCHAGKLMFLHTNMSPKWNLAIPADFDFYTRRWQVVLAAPSFAVSSLG